MVTEYRPLRKKDLKLDDTKRLVASVEILEGITGLTKKTQLPASLTASGNLKVALVEGRSGLDIGRVDVSDRSVRQLGAIYGADEGMVVRVPLVDASRYVHTVVESGKVDVVVTSGSMIADVSGQIVRAEQYGVWPVKISGERVIADISGRTVDVSDRSGRELGTVDVLDRSIRELGVIYGADAGFVVRVPLVDASRYLHTVVESGKVDVVVTSGLIVSKMSGEVVKAEQQGAWPVEISGQVVKAEQYGAWPVKISGERVITDISGGIVDVSDRSGRELGTVDKVVHAGYGTLWSGAVVNPSDNVGITVQTYPKTTAFIKSYSGEMTFRMSLHDGYDWYEMEQKTFSGDMVWSVDHVCHSLNLMTLSSGMVTARTRSLRW